MPLSDIVDRLEPEVEPVTLVLSRRAAKRFDEARQEAERARRHLARVEDADTDKMAKSPAVREARERVDAAQQAVTEAQQQADATRHTFWLRQLGNERWTELEGLVPATTDQKLTLGKGLRHNPELFPIVALAFSLVDVDDDRAPTGPAVPQAELDALDEALRAAKGNPERAIKAADRAMPDSLVELNRRLPMGGWEALTKALFDLNVEVDQVPLS